MDEIETNGGLLVYTAAGAEDDAFFGPIARSHESLEVVIKNTEGDDEHQMWMTWLSDQTPRGGRLEQLPSSLWRATFPADAFVAKRGSAAGRRRFAFSRLGSFQFNTPLPPPPVSDVVRWATDHAPDVARLLDQDGHLSGGP